MSPLAVYPPDSRVSYTPKSRYSWQIFKNNLLFADLTGLCQNRQFTITRNDSDQVSFSVSMDKLIDLASRLYINPQDIIQSWVSEIRVSRLGIPLVAGELQPWNTNVGSDRMVQLNFRGWLDLMRWRRTSDSYAGQSASYVAQDVFTKTLARTYGSSGNYDGLSIGTVPSPDTTNIYDVQNYDKKTLYDVFTEMSNEDGGIDFEFTWDKKFNIYHPAIGSIRNDILFSYPHGNVKDIQYSVDPTKSFNSLYARGKGNAESQINVTVDDLISQQTYGLREDIRDFSNTGDENQLTALAQSELNLYKQPIVLHTIVFDGSGRTSAPQVGSFNIGDLIQISVTNFQLYSDVNQLFQINKIQVDIDDNDMETVTISVAVPNT